MKEVCVITGGGSGMGPAAAKEMGRRTPGHGLETLGISRQSLFDAGESGMTAYFCARYENRKGEFGTWGPVAAAIIP